jgi:regulator of sigma E protease
MSFLITIAAFLVAIGTLVTFHELGHYWAARWCNVKILRFSIGFGKALWIRRHGPDQTEWVIAAFPLGGYVKMADERDGSADPGDVSRAFNRLPVWRRMVIVSAGPIANFVLAAFFYWVLFVAGTPGVKPFLAEPPVSTPASHAGMADFDQIVAVDDHAVQTWGDARMAFLEAAVNRSKVPVDIERPSGKRERLELDMSALTKDDLDKDFLTKLGVLPYRLMPGTELATVSRGLPAERAGLKPGDRIRSVDGVSVSRWDELAALIASKPDTPLALTIERGAGMVEVTVTPTRVEEQGRVIGRIGIAPAPAKPDPALIAKLTTVVRYGPFEAVLKAAARVAEMSLFSIKMMGRMVVGDISWKNLSGPITIADYAGQSAQMGGLSYLNFLALISISLGVLNLLPVPVLDGGQLMYHIAELIKGSPVSEKAMEIGQQVGLTLLLGLTAFAFYNDILRLSSG